MRSEASGLSTECQHAAYRLRTKKPLQWRVTGTYVACHFGSPRVRSKNAYIALAVVGVWIVLGFVWVAMNPNKGHAKDAVASRGPVTVGTGAGV